MNLTRDRMQTLGWGTALAIAFALTMALSFRVNAVKSQVRLADRQIVALKEDKLFLETEFETRANQQQLKALNDVDFGYEAPGAGQYLEGERQLAALGMPRAADAPPPILMASADAGGAADGHAAAGRAPSGAAAVIGRIVDTAEAAEIPADGVRPVAAHQRLGLAGRLSHIDRDGTARE